MARQSMLSYIVDIMQLRELSSEVSSACMKVNFTTII